MQLFPYHIKRFWWLFILLSLTGTLLTAHVIAQQDQERFLEKYAHRNEPLRIKAIKGKKGTININKKFLDDDDWLKSLYFSLENISDKNITYIQLELEFPRSDTIPPFVFDIEYGHWPSLEGSIPVDTPPPIKPGEEIVLSFSASEYAELQKLLEGQKYPKNIKHAVIDITTVIFDDGLMWRAGRLMKRDPNNPKIRFGWRWQARSVTVDCH